jgi:Tfp pilus assembly protein FimT
MSLRPSHSRRHQAGLTLAEVLVAAAIGALVMVPVARLLDTALRTQRVYTGTDDIAQQARFAMDFLASTVRAVPDVNIPGPGEVITITPAASTGNVFGKTGNGYTPPTLNNCLASSASPVALQLGSNTLSDRVTACTIGRHVNPAARLPNTPESIAAYPPVIEISLTLTSPTGESVTLTSSTRMGGG